MMTHQLVVDHQMHAFLFGALIGLFIVIIATRS